MSSKSFMTEVRNTIVKAAKKFDVKPYDLSSSQFWSVAKDIKEWEVRKLGGFTGLRDSMFPSEKGSKVQPRQKKEKTFKHVTKKLEQFKVHDANISELFKAAKLGKDDVLRIVVQPDTHVPDHDQKAIDAMCAFLKSYKPHGIINLGDFMEMGSVSHWGTNGRRFADEVKEARKVLTQINEAAGPQCIFKRFLMGNHEDWLNQYLGAKVPEFLHGLDEIGTSLKLEDLVGFKDFGYRVVPLNEILGVGSAHFIHGYYTGNSHAKKHLDVFGVNIYYGHLHDVQSYCGVSVKGLHEAMSMGCLRTLDAGFLKGRPSNWSHALGIFEFRSDGSYTRYVPIMVDHQFTFNGKLFKG